MRSRQKMPLKVASSQHVQRDLGVPGVAINFQCRSSFARPAEALSQDQPSADASTTLGSHPLQNAPIRGQELDVVHELVQASGYSTAQAGGGTTSQGGEIETQVLALAEEFYQAGHTTDAHTSGHELGKLRLCSKRDFDRAAWAILSKVEFDPKYCAACACLSRALHVACTPGKRSETFFHSLLDVCQTAFEHLLFSPEEKIQLAAPGPTPPPSNHNDRMSSVVRFAGHLYRQRMLGVQVVGSMVEDLLANHAVECARELLEFIGLSLDAYEHSLGTLVEDDVVDAEGD